VVLGEATDALSSELDGLDAVPVVNREWRSGMASSLRTGLSFALDMYTDLEAVMVLVCDQPRLGRPLLHDLMLIHSTRRPAITASRYKDTLGVPAIFAEPIFGELLRLTGDQGARRILQCHREEAAWVDFPGGEFDLDTPEDLARLDL
jgi:molybdenum cofactor cytidylyltransferase